MTKLSPTEPRSISAIDRMFATIRDYIDQATSQHVENFGFAIGASDTPLVPLARKAVQGGKRFRAICSYTGAAAALSSRDTALELLIAADDTPGIRDLAVGLECYQASALVHDDVIDDSPLRRGEASAHASLTEHHQDASLIGSGAKYGIDGAILLGNLMTAAAEDSISLTIEQTAPEIASRLLRHYAQMTGEVAQGQFRDMAAGYAPISHGTQDAILSTLEVVRVKSALYSVVRPAQLGAILSGASSDFLTTLESVLEPAGLAFQLRDDALGAFGQPETIGKPNRSDITERKHTVLLALAYSNADDAARKSLDRVYTADRVSSADADQVAAILEEFGKEPHENLISTLVDRSRVALEKADLTAASADLLSHLVFVLTNRSA